MGEERRDFVRLATRLTAFIKYADTGKVVRVLVRDLGGGGACLITEGVLEQGSTFELELKLPDVAQPVTCQAEVQWSRVVEPPRVKWYGSPIANTGVRFTAVDAKTRSMIVFYTKMNAPPPGLG